jgi:3',5'-cyclic AMP phosphodiesterase CpdA
MSEKSLPSENVAEAPSPAGITRRSILRCSAWAGAGVVWSVIGGIPRALALGDNNKRGAAPSVDTNFQFVQISDTHVGFNKAANPNPEKTLQLAIDRVNALPTKPSLILHTGDITHLAKVQEFDTAAEILKGLPAPVHYVPGEHDVLDEGAGKLYLERYGKGTLGNGWYSFDEHGVHFIALVNVFDFVPKQLAQLGTEQLKWLADDLRAVSPSTPIIVFTHIPLWTISMPWGWGTQDGDQALALLKKYGSVTILNGHIHQIIQKVEGTITFHTARATAYPQPAPGTAEAPGPLQVPAEELRRYLGISQVTTEQNAHPFAITDSTLA